MAHHVEVCRMAAVDFTNLNDLPFRRAFGIHDAHKPVYTRFGLSSVAP